MTEPESLSRSPSNPRPAGHVHYDQRENLRNDILDKPHSPPRSKIPQPWPRHGTARKPAPGFIHLQIGNNIPHGVEQVKRLLRLDLLRRLPHLIQLAAVALEFIQEPVQVLEHEDLVQGERRENAVDADLDTLHLGPGGPVDRDAGHALPDPPSSSGSSAPPPSGPRPG